MDSQSITGLVRIVLVLSQVLFCAAFVFEATGAKLSAKRAAWWPFFVVEALHLLLVAALPFMTGQWPPLAWWWYIPLAPVIFWGLLAYVWVMITISTRWGRGGVLVVPFYITWSLWLYFMAWHALTFGAGAAWHGAMLGLGVLAAAVRIVLQLKPR